MRAVAGISGGRTSALMAYYLRNTERETIFCFQNTGFEAPGTYDFLERVEEDLGRPIVRLEFRAPPRGEPLKNATFAIVEHSKLARNGEPFIDLLYAAKAYREKHKNLGPVSPWARSRICTAYLKVRTQRKYCASLGWGAMPREYTEYVGLRADEPLRVAKMRARNNDRDTDERAPLAETGVVKADVLRFFAAKPFDLTISEEEGNCVHCFLKDERDLATMMLKHPEHTGLWLWMQEEFGPMRRGRPSYEQVYREAPARMEIREALAQGRAYTVDLPAHRVRLIVRQELAARQSFACECDAAKDEQLDMFDDSEAA